ncbi:MAG: S41 family peptidase [Bacteroidetes bacterium]|nr:S41 family peptidase [Bacteroidota bacterium]
MKNASLLKYSFKLFLLFTCLLVFSMQSFSQDKSRAEKFNFGFEKVLKNKPLFWDSMGSSAYRLSLDSTVNHGGRYSVVIEYNGDDPQFRAWSYTIPGNYPGKMITLSGYIKTENVKDGYAGLWMRIDPSIAFDNMGNRGITGTTDWTKYEVSLELNPIKTKQIVIGGLLVGKGKLWLDDLQVSIDGKDIGELEPIPARIFPAEKDTIFDRGSGIASIELTPLKTENLRVLGLVWGFLKYYHPSVAAGNYNWDYELFRILPQILAAGNPEKKDHILLEWINKLGEFSEGDKDTAYASEVKLRPDLAWITNSGLSTKLSSALEKVSKAVRTGENYYVGLAPGVGNPVFTNEKDYASMNCPDAGFRLLALYRYWNIIQYFFPYKHLIGENWNPLLAEFIPKFNNAKNELEYKLAVLELIARVRDTHSNIWSKETVLAEYRGKNFSLAQLTFTEGKAVITGFYNAKNGDHCILQQGDIITEISGRSIESILESKLKYTPASNYPTQLRDIARNLLRTNDTVINIRYIRNGIKTSVTLQAYPFEKIDFISFYQRKDSCFRMLAPDIAYFNPGNVKSAYLPELWKQIKDTKGLVIDLRCYPSDFIVFSFGQYLVPESTEFVRFSSGSITRPGLFTMGKPLAVGVHNTDFYKGKVIILVNEITQSQAEYTAMAFRVAPRAMVIGSTTAGADGNVSEFRLPGGIRTMISGIGVYYPDRRETQRVGIVPDLEVKPTIEGIIAHKDEPLLKAIEIIKAP